MSRRKQSHPRAWKETTDKGEESCHPHSPKGVGDGSNREAEETDQEKAMETDEPQTTGLILDAILKAQAGEMIGPFSASICRRDNLKSEDKEGLPQLFKMVLEGAEGSMRGTLEFTSISKDGEPHLEIRKSGPWVYVKVVKIVEDGTKVRGCMLEDNLEDTESKEQCRIKQEPDEENGGGGMFSSTNAPSTETSPAVIEGTNDCGKDLTARGSPIPAERSPIPARGSPIAGRSPITRENSTSPKTSEAVPPPDEEIASGAQKCPNCSVCFRNRSNLEAHLAYYCTGRDRVTLMQGDSLETSTMTLLASKSPSPTVSPRNARPSDRRNSSPVHVCQLCQSSFMSKQNCESHMLILHCSEHVPMCRFCNFVAKSWDVLREHVFTHVKVEQPCLEHHSEGSRGSGGVSKETRMGVSGNREPKDDPLVVGRDPYEGKLDAKRTRASPSADQRLSIISHPNGMTKRTIVRSEEAGGKRLRLSDPLPSTSREVQADDPIDEKASSEDCYTAPPAYICRACSICFRSRENYLAHKQYYCKQRLTEGMEGGHSREDSPDQTLHPRRKPAERITVHEDVEGAPRSRSESDRLVPNIHNTPMMYMSPVVPSAMLLGGTQLISPSGAHVISPIFLVTPPVAISMAGIEPHLSLPSAIRKDKNKSDTPLDLSRRASHEERRTPAILKTEQSDRTSPEETQTSENFHERSSSPTKSFLCGHCGTRFWKASTLSVHKQLYCSALARNRDLPHDSRESGNSEQNAAFHNTSGEPARTNNKDAESREGAREANSRGSPSKSVLTDTLLQGSRMRGKHLDYYRANGARCSINEYLEHIYARNCQEKQMLEGLRICSGCGVSFRKLESLEIHQKFYCQASNSQLSAERASPPRQEPSASRQQSSPLGHIPAANLRHNGSIASPARRNEHGENGQHLDKSEHSLEKLCGDFPVTNTEGPASRQALLAGEKSSEENGQTSLCMPKVITDSIPEGVEERLSPNNEHEQKERLSPADSSLPEEARRDWPSATTCRSEVVIKVEGDIDDCSHRESNPQNSAREASVTPDPSSPAATIRIKIESTSSESSQTSNREPVKGTQQAHTNGRTVSPVSMNSLVTPRKPSAIFPPGSKACKSCNISFRSLSTFIAHKKYYCSGTASLRSNVAS